MEFRKAKEQANRLDQIARDLDQTADNELGGILSRINNAWSSDTTAKYIKKGNVVQNNLKARAKELRSTANTIRTIAKNTYDAEMKAYQIAIQRKFDS